MQSEPACRAPHGLGLEDRTFEGDASRCVAHLAALPAHDAREGDRSLDIGDDQVAGREFDVAPVEQSEPFALPRPARDQTLSPNAIEVEGVQRLAALEHDVVRHVDGRAKWAHAARRQAAAHPERGATAGYLGPLSAVPGTEFMVLDLGSEGLFGRLGHRGRLAPFVDLRAPERSDLAGDAKNRGAIAAIGRDREVEHDRLGQQTPERCSWRDRLGRRQPEVGRVEREKSRVVVAESQVALRAEHRLGAPTAQFPHLDRGFGQGRTRQRHRKEPTGRRVRRPADDLQRSFAAHVHAAGADAGLARDRLGREDRTRHDRIRDRVAGDVLDLEPSGGEASRETVDVGRDLDEFSQPIERDAHRSSA